MDWNRKLLVFVCLPMLSMAGVSLWASSWDEEEEPEDEAAAKAMEDPDNYRGPASKYEPDYYEPDWEDAGFDEDLHFDEYPPDGVIDEDYDYNKSHGFDYDDDRYSNDDYMGDEMWDSGSNQMYVEEEPPPKDDGWPWMTIVTAGIGSLTGLISALSSLLKNVASLRRKKEDEEEEDKKDEE